MEIAKDLQKIYEAGQKLAWKTGVIPFKGETDLVFIHMNQVQHFHLKGEVKKIE